jgi:hypothetical protein
VNWESSESEARLLHGDTQCDDYDDEDDHDDATVARDIQTDEAFYSLVPPRQADGRLDKS